MMSTRIVSTALVLAFVGVANASPITGGISFSDGFAPGTYPDGHNTAIMSDMTLIRVGDTTLAQGCSGDFAVAGECVPNSGTFATTFSLIDGAQVVYNYNGFSFFGNIFGPITRNALECDGRDCSDSLLFNATGFITGNDHDITAMLMSWTGQGTCTQWPANTDAPPMTMCEGDVSASWSSSIAAQAQAQPVPVSSPGTLALLGVGILGVATARSKRRW